MLFKAAILAGIAALFLLSAPLEAGATKPFSPTFDILDVSPPTLGPSAHGDVSRQVSLPEGHHLPAIETLSVPAGWGIAADADVPNEDVVGSGSLSVNQGTCPGTPLAFAFDIVDKPADPGDKAHWAALIDGVLSFDFVINGSSAGGHTIEALLFYDPAFGEYCTPMDLTIVHKGISSPSGSVVLTNPDTQGLYTWQATYRPAPLPPQHPDVTRSDSVAIGPDGDADGVPEFVDNCPGLYNPRPAPGYPQTDTDGDGQGNECDPDDDNDGVLDGADNCPLTPNADQTDTDGDGLGNACDPDDDNDGVIDPLDNCPTVANPGQENLDGDSMGDACDPDDDNDGHLDPLDNCPTVANPGQENFDGDSLGDACDPDVDNDGVANASDLCAFTPLGTAVAGDGCPDPDADGVSTFAGDNCPTAANPGQENFDGDSMGDVCDPDIDGDGWLNTIEDHVGTGNFKPCALNFIADDEADDGRPPDLNDDRGMTGADLSQIAGVIGTTVPPTPVRRDIAPDPAGDNGITGADLSRVAGIIGTAC